MNYTDITNNVDSGRTSLRRIARHDEPEFSNASILNSMETFVRTVSEMEDTILVPSRLLDLSVGDASDTISMKNKQGASIKDTLAHTDLYRLYNIVNQMKVELLWSQEPGKVPAHDQDECSQKNVSEGTTRLGHNRCPSTTSMQSVKSASSIASITTSSSSSAASDCDSDNGIEIDSGLENEESNNHDRLANQAAENFRRHLRGLHRSIERMTEAAQYLTLRYQADVGGQV